MRTFLYSGGLKLEINKRSPGGHFEASRAILDFSGLRCPLLVQGLAKPLFRRDRNSTPPLATSGLLVRSGWSFQAFSVLLCPSSAGGFTKAVLVLICPKSRLESSFCSVVVAICAQNFAMARSKIPRATVTPRPSRPLKDASPCRLQMPRALHGADGAWHQSDLCSEHLDVFCTWPFVSTPFGKGHSLSYLQLVEAHTIQG